MGDEDSDEASDSDDSDDGGAGVPDDDSDDDGMNCFALAMFPKLLRVSSHTCIITTRYRLLNAFGNR